MQLASPILFLSLLSAHVRAPCQVLCHTFVACVGGVFRGLQDKRRRCDSDDHLLFYPSTSPNFSAPPVLPAQGVFRGLQDTRAPLAATIASNIINIILAPVLIFGVSVV